MTSVIVGAPQVVEVLVPFRRDANAVALSMLGDPDVLHLAVASMLPADVGSGSRFVVRHGVGVLLRSSAPVSPVSGVWAEVFGAPAPHVRVAVSNGDRFHVSVDAVAERSKAGQHGTRGRRSAITDPDELSAWLLTRQMGATVTRMAYPTMRAVTSHRLGCTWRVARFDFDCVVNDPGMFAEFAMSGIGRRRAFGFGVPILSS